VALQEAENRRRHHLQTAKLARELREALSIEPPLWGTKGLDWDAIDRTLERVSRSAREEGHVTQRHHAGPPPLQWRDGMIALVHAHYPPAHLTLSCSSHFVETIALLLKFLGEDLDLDHVYKQTRRSLERGSEPPFVLE
jgi:hypothetical protein